MEKKFNLFKLLQNLAVIGLFLVIGMGVLFITGMLERTITSIELTIIVGLLLAGLLLVLPWAKYLEQKEYKLLSMIFLVSTAVCVVLWVICTMVVCHAIRTQSASDSLLYLVRGTLLISLQILIASFIGKFVIKYKTKYIPFQAITYLSLIYIDFWISTALFGMGINDGNFTFAQSAKNIIFQRTTVSLLILALIYLITALAVIDNSRRRRVRNTILSRRNSSLNRDIGILDLGDDEDDEEETPATKTTAITDAEAQLEKLKNMYDKGLITKDEYDAKRQAIIDKM